MEEVLVDHIFNPLGFRFVCCGREVIAFKVLIQELLVLRLEVFGMNTWRGIAVQKFALQGQTYFNSIIKCNVPYLLQ